MEIRFSMPHCLYAGFDNFVHAQRNRFHGKRQYLFIESICYDPDILQQNYRYKMMYSPDYKSTEADKVTFLNYAERSFDTAVYRARALLACSWQDKCLVSFVNKRILMNWGVQALNDFKERIEKYEEVYETITDRNMHYIKLIDMCETPSQS